MNEGEIYKFIGFLAVTVFFLYLISKALNLNLNFKKDVTEGMASAELIANVTKNKENRTKEEQKSDQTIFRILVPMENLKENVTKKADLIKIYENKTDYHDIIVYLHQAVGYTLLTNTLQYAANITQDPNTTKAKSEMDEINKLKQFMESLEYAVKTLDEYEPS